MSHLSVVEAWAAAVERRQAATPDPKDSGPRTTLPDDEIDPAIRVTLLGFDVDSTEFFTWVKHVIEEYFAEVGLTAEDGSEDETVVNLLGDLVFNAFLTGLYHERRRAAQERRD